jgi:hypothetical protein
VAQGDSASVEVSFQPSALGSRAATLRLTSDDLDESTVDLALTGQGVTPDVAVIPASHDYGGVRLAATAAHTFTVLNAGTAALSVSATTVEGLDAAEFSITAGAGPFAVAPGDWASVAVTFSPTTLGPKTAALRLATDDLDTPTLDVPLTGQGAEPDIAVNPASHDYGDARLNEIVSQTFVVSNEGTTDLAVTATTLEGVDAGDFRISAGAGPFTVAQGDSASVEVSFQPSALGSRAATLRLTSDDLDESGGADDLRLGERARDGELLAGVRRPERGNDDAQRLGHDHRGTGCRGVRHPVGRWAIHRGSG